MRKRVEREVHAFRRDDARARDEQRAVLGREAKPHELCARSERRPRNRPCEQQQPDRVPELVLLEPARMSKGVIGLGCDSVFPEPVLDRLLVVPELAECLADGAGGVAVG